MSIIRHDSLYIKAPFPADIKTVVGPSYLFTDKDSIPASYRYYGMRVFEAATGLYYKLESNLTTWTLIKDVPSWVQNNQSSVLLNNFGGNLDWTRIENAPDISPLTPPIFTAMTLPPGSDASVTGTYPNLTIGVPQGLRGLQGLQGPQGLQGLQGDSVFIQGSATVGAILIKEEDKGIIWIATDAGEDSYGNPVVPGEGLISDGTGWLNIGQIRGPSGDAYGNALISYSLIYLSGFDYYVSAPIYKIQGITYNAPGVFITLDGVEEGEVYNRIDVFVADINGNIYVLKGAPAESPIKPAVKDTELIELGFVIIGPSSLDGPIGVTKTTIWDENLGEVGGEWDLTVTAIAGTVNPNYTLESYSNSKSISVANATNVKLKFTSSTPIAFYTDMDVLSFYIKNLDLSTWADTTVTLYSNLQKVSDTVLISPLDYDYTEDGWRVVGFNLLDLNPYDVSFNTIEIDITSSNVNNYVTALFDLIETSGGTGQPSTGGDGPSNTSELVNDGENGTDPFIFQTYSRVIKVTPGDLSGVGTLEEQITEYINTLAPIKEGDDAEYWVEYEDEEIDYEVNSFIGLSDTFNSYEGLNGFQLIVNQDGTGIEAVPTLLARDEIYVTWIGLLDFRVNAVSYSMYDGWHSAPETIVTLPPNTSEYDRIDLLVVTVNNTATFIPGTPSPNPEYPSYDPYLFKAVKFILVKSGQSTPEGFFDVSIWDENSGQPLEWEFSSNEPLSSVVTSPAVGTISGDKAINVISTTNTTRITFESATPFFTKDLNFLSFYLKLKEFYNNSVIVLRLYDNFGNLIGDPLTIFKDTFGFDSKNLSWQQLIIPRDRLTIPVDASCYKIELHFAKAFEGLYIDKVDIQMGGERPITGETITRTSQLINDGEFGTSRYIEETDLLIKNINRVISGQVIWTGVGYTFKSVYLVYEIDGILYSSHDEEITLDPPDADPRIDVIYVTTLGLAKLEGMPSTTPLEPNLVSPNYQLKTNIVLVQAGTTEPVLIINKYIYKENLGQAGGEWDATESTSGFRITLDNTILPVYDSKDIKTLMPLERDDKIILTSNDSISVVDFNFIKLHFKSLATWLVSDRILLRFMDNGTQAGIGYITPTDLDTSNQAVIHAVYKFKEDLTFTGSKFNSIEITAFNTFFNPTTSIEFQLDDILLQYGNTIPPVFYSGVESVTGNLVDNTDPSNPIVNSPINVGYEGQLLFYEERIGNKLENDYLLKRGIVTENAEELAIARETDIELQEVFLTWQMFSHYNNSSIQGNPSPPYYPAYVFDENNTIQDLTESEFWARDFWVYEELNDRILLTQNFNQFTGFVSPISYSDYTLEATLSSNDSDDDYIALVIGFDKDPITGFEKTLVVARGTNPFIEYKVYYNLHQINNGLYPDYQYFVVADGSDLAPSPGGGWSTAGQTRVRVNRTGNIFSIKCSQFGSTIIDDATEIIIDLDNADERLAAFKEDSRVGFSALSQKNAAFSDISFTGFTGLIFNVVDEFNVETWEYDTNLGEHVLQSPTSTTPRDIFKIGRLIYSYLFDKTYYVDERYNLIKISGPDNYLKTIPTLQEVTTAGNQTDDKVIVEGVQFNDYSRDAIYSEIVKTIEVINADTPWKIYADKLGNFYFTRGITSPLTDGSYIGKLDVNNNYTEINVLGTGSTFLAIDPYNNVYVSCGDSNTISKIDSYGNVVVLATLPDAPLFSIFNSDDDTLIVSTRPTSPSTGQSKIYKIAQNGGYSVFSNYTFTIMCLALGKDGYLYGGIYGTAAGIAKINIQSGAYTVLGTARFDAYDGRIVTDSENNLISVQSFNQTVVQKTTQAGDTTIIHSAFAYMEDIEIDENDNLYILSRGATEGSFEVINKYGDTISFLLLANEANYELLISPADGSVYYFNTTTFELKRVVFPIAKLLSLDDVGNIVENKNIYTKDGIAYLPYSTLSKLNNPKAIATLEYVDNLPNKGVITTETDITALTLTDEGYMQEKKVIGIDNGAIPITYTVNEGITSSFIKLGTGSITFVQGVGRTLIDVYNNGLVLNTLYGTASIESFGTLDLIYINNV